MKEIVITYYPLVGGADLWVDGELIDPMTNSVAGRMKKMEEKHWLGPVRSGYQYWRGLPMELMDEVDDDEILVTVEGPESFCRQVLDTFQAQKNDTDAIGFRHDRWQVRQKPMREIPDCAKELELLYRQCVPFLHEKGQEEALLIQKFESGMESADSWGSLYETSRVLARLLEEEARLCGEDEGYRQVFDDFLGQLKSDLWGIR